MFMKISFIFLLIIHLFTSSVKAETFGAWERINIGLSGEGFKEISFEHGDSIRYFLLTENNLYSSPDGQNWKRIFRIRGEEASLNSLLLDKSSSLVSPQPL